jgi:hypothetical protein
MLTKTDAQQLLLEQYACPETKSTYLAVDANPYDIRLTSTTPDGLLLDQLEAKPHQIVRVLNFVRSQRRMFPGIVLTGARTDRWPAGLLPALVIEFGPISWAPELLLKKTLPEFRRCTKLLRFFRATFLAICAAQDHTSESRGQQVLTQWKKAVLWELSLDFDVAVPPDDIPF